MDKKLSSNELPLGLGMALAQNVDALNRFVMLSDTQKKAVVEKSGTMTSKQEMQSFVNSIGESSFT